LIDHFSSQVPAMSIRVPLSFFVIFLLTATQAALASQCPAALQTTNRLVLVTAPDMNREQVTMRLFVRDARKSAWRSVGRPRQIVIGRAGMAWGHTYRMLAKSGEPIKREGDKRTPAGFFNIGASFGFERSSRPGHVVLRKDETICVDDVRSTAYNTVQSRAAIGPKAGGENMRTYAIYRHGLFVAYPSNRKAKAGSCIFLHLMTKSGRGTLGCLAMPEMTLLGLQSFTEPGAVLGVLPSTAFKRFAGCLPAR
jgi:L,D-peptidoglycan transpeptidase YkuD (ErfK/YbiS/YcfS/YnhG family)